MWGYLKINSEKSNLKFAEREEENGDELEIYLKNNNATHLLWTLNSSR